MSSTIKITLRVDVRFNTNYPKKSRYQWRVIVNGNENLVNDVRFEIPCYTTSEFIEGQGLKHHISADANNIEYSNLGIGLLTATIK